MAIVGEFLLKRSWVTQEQLELARLHASDGNPQPIEWILVQLGILTPAQAVRANALMDGTAFFDFESHLLSRDVALVVSCATAASRRLIAVSHSGNHVYVAMANWRDQEAIATVQAQTGLRVIPLAAVPEHIEEAIAQTYPLDQLPWTPAGLHRPVATDGKPGPFLKVVEGSDRLSRIRRRQVPSEMPDLADVLIRFGNGNREGNR